LVLVTTASYSYFSISLTFRFPDYQVQFKICQDMDLPTVALLRSAYNALSKQISVAMQEVAPDQRPSHGNVMEQLDFEDGLRLTDLAEGAGMAPQSIGELVDQLEDLGYVERRPDPDDRRAKRVYRTAKGRKASETARATAFGTEAELRDLLGDEELARFRMMLIRIVDEVGGNGEWGRI
jgi:DNA-binding MarR family transcriptional regulator